MKPVIFVPSIAHSLIHKVYKENSIIEEKSVLQKGFNNLVLITSQLGTARLKEVPPKFAFLASRTVKGKHLGKDLFVCLQGANQLPNF
jgi:hypothetical protein